MDTYITAEYYDLFGFDGELTEDVKNKFQQFRTIKSHGDSRLYKQMLVKVSTRSQEITSDDKTS